MTNVGALDIRCDWRRFDLGANRLTTAEVVIHSQWGIISGVILVFLPAMTIFYIPDILGGAKSILVGNLIQNSYSSRKIGRSAAVHKC